MGKRLLFTSLLCSCDPTLRRRAVLAPLRDPKQGACGARYGGGSINVETWVAIVAIEAIIWRDGCKAVSMQEATET